MTDDLSVLTRPARSPDQVVAYGPDPDHIADIRWGTQENAAHEKRPLILIVHGGFWRPQYDLHSHAGPMARSHRGCRIHGCFSRISPRPRRPGQNAERRERAALVELPRSPRSTMEKVVLVGHSAGGHLVLWLSAVRRSPALAGVLAQATARRSATRSRHESGRRRGCSVPQAAPEHTPRRRPEALCRRRKSQRLSFTAKRMWSCVFLSPSRTPPLTRA